MNASQHFYYDLSRVFPLWNVSSFRSFLLPGKKFLCRSLQGTYLLRQRARKSEEYLRDVITMRQEKDSERLRGHELLMVAIFA